jgi:hypothetical protein
MTITERLVRVPHDRAPGQRVTPSRPTGWSLSPGQRKLVLSAHILVSVGLLGIYAAMLILGTVAALTPDLQTSHAAYRSMGIFTRGVIPTGAVGVVATGVILALGTNWGLFKHYWVVAKLGLTAAVLPVSIFVVFPSVRQAITATSAGAPEPGGWATLLVVASGANVLMLAAAAVIGVYKPWGAIGLRRGATAGSPA